jgi:hypothetical protein
MNAEMEILVETRKEEIHEIQAGIAHIRLPRIGLGVR